MTCRLEIVYVVVVKDEEFEFILLDRIAKIKSLSEQYDLSKSYVSFSGGKDSTVLSALIDIALPNNEIKRIYKDTGIEYPQIRKFVKNKVLNDKRYIYIKPNKNIQKTLKKVGFPFKSKQHSHNFQVYKNNIEICEKYKKEIIENGLAKRIQNGTSTQEDIDYIFSLPKGTKTFVKYYFGIRSKEKRSATGKERTIYKYKDCP